LGDSRTRVNETEQSPIVTYHRQVDQPVPGGRLQEVHPASVHARVGGRGPVHRQMVDRRVRVAFRVAVARVKVRPVAERGGRGPRPGRARDFRRRPSRVVPATER